MSLTELRNLRTGEIKTLPVGFVTSFPDTWTADLEPTVSAPAESEAIQAEIESPKSGKKEDHNARTR